MNGNIGHDGHIFGPNASPLGQLHETGDSSVACPDLKTHSLDGGRPRTTSEGMLPMRTGPKLARLDPLLPEAGLASYGRRRSGSLEASRFHAFVLVLLVAVVVAVAGDNPLLAVPVIAVAAVLLLVGPTRLRSGPSIATFSAVAGVRYVLGPVLAVVVPHVGLSSQAVSLFAVESIVMAVVLVCLYGTRQEGLQLGVQLSRQFRVAFPAVVILAGVAALIALPESRTVFNTVLTSTGELLTQRTSEGPPGPVYLLTQWARVWTPVIVVATIWRREERAPLLAYGISLLIFGASLLVFSGTSRQSSLIPGVACLFLLIRLYPNRKRFTLFSFAIALLAAFALLTQLKETTYYVQSTSSQVEKLSRTFELYFNGVTNLDISLQAFEIYGPRFNWSTRIADLFGNVPGTHIDISERTIEWFNAAYYGGRASVDQIIPFTGQALFHWGPALIWVPILLLLLAIRAVDAQFQKQADPILVYAIGYVAVMLGMAFMLNFSILFAHLASTGLPVLGIALLNNSLSVRKTSK